MDPDLRAPQLPVHRQSESALRTRISGTETQASIQHRSLLAVYSPPALDKGASVHRIKIIGTAPLELTRRQAHRVRSPQVHLDQKVNIHPMRTIGIVLLA